MPKEKKQPNPLGVNQCSLCEEITLTIGQQHLGGVRYCRDCIQKTFSWVKLTEEQKSNILAKMNKIMENPTIAKLIQDGKNLTPEDKKSFAIGEARRRLFESMQ